MYDIGIKEIICNKKSISNDERCILYKAEAAERPSVCANESCKCQIKPHVHSYSENRLHDVKSEGKLVLIDLKIRRYRCPKCGYVFSEVFSFYEKNSHITNRLKKEFIDRCIKGETFSYIANDYSVDHKTVANIFKAYANTHKNELSIMYTPEVLGLDEAHIDDHYRLVITDIKNQKLLDMRRDNKASTVNAYLRTLDKDICQCVTMDFAPVYAKCVSTMLPKSLIVIDKFHVIQEVNKCLDKTRILLIKQYQSEGYSLREFKNSKYLFMSNWEDLTPDGMDRVNHWLMTFPDMYISYMTKESFRDIYAIAKTYDEAEEMFDKWFKTIPFLSTFEPMRKTMSRRKEHILNYWNAPYTNAYTESVNNAIKRIEKAGRGYKFDTLRERCMLEINTPKLDKFNPKNAVFTDITMDLDIVLQERYAHLYNATETVKKKESFMSEITKDIPSNSQAEVDIVADVKGDIGKAIHIYFEHFNQEKASESLLRRIMAYQEAMRKL